MASLHGCLTQLAKEGVNFSSTEKKIIEAIKREHQDTGVPLNDAPRTAVIDLLKRIDKDRESIISQAIVEPKTAGTTAEGRPMDKGKLTNWALMSPEEQTAALGKPWKKSDILEAALDLGLKPAKSMTIAQVKELIGKELARRAAAEVVLPSLDGAVAHAEGLGAQAAVEALRGLRDEIANGGPIEGALTKMADILEGLEDSARAEKGNVSVAPPVPEGMVRLYRGESARPPGNAPQWVLEAAKSGGQADAYGRWFTPDREAVDWYVKDAPDGRLMYVDVPKEVFESSKVAGKPEARFSRDPEIEHFLPREWADKKQPFVEKGTGPGTGEGPGAQKAGSTQEHGLSDLEQLQQSLREHPEIPKREQMVRGVARQRWSGDALLKGIGNMRAKAVELFDRILRPPTTTDFKKILGNYLYDKQKTSYEAYHFVKDLNKRYAPPRQVAITNYIQAGGDMKQLKEWYDRSLETDATKPYAQGYFDAMNLTDRERVVAENVRQYLQSRFEQLHAAGILDSAVENYATQIWGKDSPMTRSVVAQANANLFQKDLKYALHKHFSSYFAGEQAGVTPRNKAVGFWLTAYDKAVNDALSTRAFIKALSGSSEKTTWGKFAEQNGLHLGQKAKNVESHLGVLPEVRGVFERIKEKGVPVEVTERLRWEDAREEMRHPKRLIAVEYRLPQGKGPKGWQRASLTDELTIDTTPRGKDGNPLISVSGAASDLKASDGIPEAVLIKPRASEKGVPADVYHEINHPALRKWKWIGESDAGTPMIMEGQIKVHNDIFKHMKALLEPSRVQESSLGRGALKVTSELKATLLSASMFHQTQEGFHALLHRVNPFNPEPISFKDARTANLVKNGLMVFDHASSALFSEGVHSSGLLQRVPGIGPLLNRYSTYLFSDYIPRLKVKMAHEALERNMERYKGKLSDSQIYEITANQANAAFGELNYTWMGRHKTTQDIMRLALLAPDFLEARARFTGQALKGLMDIPGLRKVMPGYGAEQAVALFAVGTLGQFIPMRILNALFNDGDPKWHRPFSLIIPKGVPGIGGREYAMRSVPADIWHLLQKPGNFVYYRANPTTVRTMQEMVFGRDQWGRPRNAGQQFWDFAQAHAPIPLQGVVRALFGAGGSDTPIFDVLTASVGVTSYEHKTRAEGLAKDKLAYNLGHIPQTGDRELTAPVVAKLAKKLRAGEDISEETSRALANDQISMKHVKKIHESAKKPVLVNSFGHLIESFPTDALEVWDVANEEEKGKLRPLMRQKLNRLREGGGSYLKETRRSLIEGINDRLNQ